FAAPSENGSAALLPVAHGVPVAGFIGTQALMSAETRVAPELRDLIEAGIDSGGDALPFRIARPKQQNVSARFDVANYRTDTLHGVSRHERLFCKNVFELLVVFVGEGQIVGFFDLEAALVRLANAATAGAFHAVEQLFFRAGQVGAIGTVILRPESGGLAVFEAEVRRSEEH